MANNMGYGNGAEQRAQMMQSTMQKNMAKAYTPRIKTNQEVMSSQLKNMAVKSAVLKKLPPVSQRLNVRLANKKQKAMGM